MRVRGGQSKAGQDPQRSHRGNCKKRIPHSWYATYLSDVGYRLDYRVPARTERPSLCTVKRISRGSENWNLTDDLEPQGAVDIAASKRERKMNRHVAPVLRVVIGRGL
jgi:hypothetical protein